MLPCDLEIPSALFLLALLSGQMKILFNIICNIKCKSYMLYNLQRKCRKLEKCGGACSF